MAKKKADEVKKALDVPSEGIPKVEAQNFYSGKEPYVEVEEPEGNKITVIGIVEAEKLQKSGWLLVDATRTNKKDPFSDKTYKFERNK